MSAAEVRGVVQPLDLEAGSFDRVTVLVAGEEAELVSLFERVDVREGSGDVEVVQQAESSYVSPAEDTRPIEPVRP